MQETNPNVHSHKIRELADRIGKIEVVYGEAGESMSTAKAYLHTLASIHELLSDNEFNSDTFQAAGDSFAIHGLDLFGMDSELDEDSLKAKYAGDDSERKHSPGEHPAYTRRDWLAQASCGNTDRGYWEWVRVQIEDNE